MAIQKIN